MEHFYTYIISDPSRNNEAFYVGKGKNERAWSHLSRKDKHPLTHRFNKMRQNGITPNISLYSELDEELAFFLEEELIAKFGRKDLGTGTLLNMTNGGDGGAGYVVSEETRKKISIAGQGRKCSEETKRLMSATRTGEIRSEETKSNISKSKKGQKYSKIARFNMSLGQTGRVHTPERNAKVSAGLLGHVVSLETRTKISKAIKGKFAGEKNSMFNKTQTDETKEKIRIKASQPWSEERRAKYMATRKANKEAAAFLINQQLFEKGE